MIALPIILRYRERMSKLAPGIDNPGLPEWAPPPPTVAGDYQSPVI